MSTDTLIESAYDRAVARATSARADLAAEEKAHAQRVRVIRDRIADAEAVIAFAERGGNAQDFEIARDVIDLKWAREPGRHQRMSDYPRTGPVKAATPEVQSTVAQAIADLRAGCPVMSHHYFGVKSYDRWPSQDIGAAPYGCGPSHGSVWFSIGLVPTYRGKGVQALQERQRIAAIRYLQAILERPELLGGDQ